jgi:hypothetical protein
MSGSIVEKIRKLLAMANHPNSNPSEAANAAAFAASLAVAHNVDLDALADRPAKVFGQVISSWHFTPGDQGAVWGMANWVSRLFGCRAFVCGKKYISFVGQKHNTDLAHSWMSYLWNSCLRANTEHARQSAYGSKVIRQQARENFRANYSVSVCERLKEKYEALRATGPTSDSRALVVAAWFDAESREVTEWVDRTMRTGTFASRRTAAHLDSAAAAGREAGRRVGLHDQIGRS